MFRATVAVLAFILMGAALAMQPVNAPPEKAPGLEDRIEALESTVSSLKDALSTQETIIDELRQGSVNDDEGPVLAAAPSKAAPLPSTAADTRGRSFQGQVSRTADRPTFRL
jgi:hypothetical protein